MKKLNFLKPDRENLNTYLYIGSFLFFVSITMFTYLSISLSISLLMNWYNKKIAIKEK